MRYSKVSPDGKYEKYGHLKANYTTMIMVRSGFVMEASEVTKSNQKQSKETNKTKWK